MKRHLINAYIIKCYFRYFVQKMLNQAPTEAQLLNGGDQSINESLETASLSQSTRSISVSGMTSSLGCTSSYSIKSLTSSASGVTLAPSSCGSVSSKSSLKKSPTKRYSLSRTTRDFENYPGYNKLRLDSAVSPKHSPRNSTSAEKVTYFILTLSSNSLLV